MLIGATAAVWSMVLPLTAPQRAKVAAAPADAVVARVYLPLVAALVDRTELPAAPTALATATATAPAPTTVAPSPTGSPPPVDPTPSPTAVPTGSPLGPPLAVAESDRGRWVFEPFPDAVCGRGTATGLGLNFVPDSTDLVIYFEGGGACWDPFTCLLAQTASNLDGVDKTKFDAAVEQGQIGKGIFDRGDPTNPFRTMNWIYVPYCTGDAHLGDRIATYQGQSIHHVGWKNVDAFLRRIVPTFRGAGRVVVAGFSAGGLGSTGNVLHVADAFQAVDGPVPELIDDAGPIVRPPYLTAAAQAKLHDAWGLGGTIEQRCPSCRPSTGYHEVYAFLARTLPGFRGSLISSYEDGTIRSFFTLLNGAAVDGPAMRRGLDDLADWSAGWDPTDIPGRLRVFFYPGERHGALTTGPLSATPGLLEFLQAQLGNDAGWSSVRP
ncbi:MAG: pectin acetylesterase-family hydrolase [Ardenticatenales bacterium]